MKLMLFLRDRIISIQYTSFSSLQTTGATLNRACMLIFCDISLQIINSFSYTQNKLYYTLYIYH